MVRKININGQEYIGNSNALLTRYIVDKIRRVAGVPELCACTAGGLLDIPEEVIGTLCRVTISKEEAKNLLCLDDKKIVDMVAELYPDVPEEDFEYIADDLIDEIISETFRDLMGYTETFYENGVSCMVSVIYGVVFNKNIEIEVSPRYIEHYIKRSINKFRVVSLDAIKRLKSVHSTKLYSYLMYELSLFENNEMPVKVQITLDILKKLLYIHGDKYENYGDFKRRILTASIEEMNQLDYNITFNEIKDGRKVVAIEFEINEKEK